MPYGGTDTCAWRSSACAATATLLLLATALGSSVAVAQDEAPPTVEVTGDDYAFVGLPSSVPVGTSFRFVNGGDEDHEMFIARRNEGTTETLRSSSRYHKRSSAPR